MTQNPAGADDGGRTGRRLSLAEKVLAVLAAVVTLVAAVLGLVTAQLAAGKDQAEQSAQSSDTELRDLQARFDDLQRRFAALEAENTRLRSNGALPGSSAEPEPSSGPTVRHQGELVLVSGGQWADLDSPQTNAQWDANLSQPEIRSLNGHLSLNTRALSLGTRKADYASCSGASGYDGAVIDLGNVAAGDHFCVRTTDDRFAALRLTALHERSVAFDVVVYGP